MSEKIVKDLEIKNIKGLHARAAAAFVKTIEPFDCFWIAFLKFSI